MPHHPPLELELELRDAWPPRAWRDVTVLLAVSGGADSLAMLRSMVALRDPGEGRIVVAHFNHGLRKDDSDADQAFVIDLCRELGLDCQTGRVSPNDDLSDAPCSDGLEAAARDARYAFLRHTADRLGARYVATAHTADDQAETILHRILRGTGVAGLAGMARTRPLSPGCSLIRPLLTFPRSWLVEYLGQVGQPYREDASNRDVRFTRNRIRHELLPLLAERFNPAVSQALLRLGRLAEESQAVIDGLVEELLQRHVSSAESVLITLPGLDIQPRYLLRELLIAVWRRQAWPLQSMGFEEWDRLAEMVAATSCKRTLPGNIVAEVRDDVLCLTPAH